MKNVRPKARAEIVAWCLKREYPCDEGGWLSLWKRPTSAEPLDQWMKVRVRPLAPKRRARKGKN